MAVKYPLTVAFERGRVFHSAREYNGRLVTLCGARGTTVADPPSLPWCTACANKPNPIDNRSRGVTVGKAIIALIPGAEGAGIKP